MLKNLSVYLLTTIINRGIPFILLPFLTQKLNPADYGIIAVFQLAIAFLHPVLNLNGHLLISKEYYVAGSDLKLINSNQLFIVSAFALILCLFASILFFFPSINLGIPPSWWLILIILGIFNSINLNYLSILRCENKVFKYGLFEIIKSLINVLGSILLINIYNFGWTGRAFGISISILLFGTISFIELVRHNLISFVPNKEIVNYILKFSLHLLPYSIGLIIINFSDRIFIEKFDGLSRLGIYSVGYTLGMSLVVITESFNKAWSPTFFKLSQEFIKNKSRIYKVIILYSLGIFVAPLFLFLLSKLIIFPYFIGKKYSESLRYVMGVGFAYSFQGLFLILYPFLVFLNKTKILGICTTCSLLLNLLLNYLLIQKFSLTGAVYATILTYFFMVSFIVLYIRKQISIIK
jgi:O-antigen/teichoic acid export membrane protein